MEMPFRSLALCEPLARAVAERGYLEATPIQQQAIPAVLRGGDVIASAPTGSGKTAAFVLPILQAFVGAERPRPLPVRALVLVPTRELAAQIGASFRTYGRHLPHVRAVVAFGGVSINLQMLALRGGADIVVATPGRLLDLVDSNAVHLSSVTTLVLDEADRLLALGFEDELRRVLAMLPARRQNLLFSATLPPAVQALADGLLRDPTRIAVEAVSLAPDIVHRAIEVDVGKRTPLLRHLLRESGGSQFLVFVATKYGADHLVSKLRATGTTAAALHGDLAQGARTRGLADFKAGSVQVLVATDVAARGLDIAGLPFVVNYDLPRSAVDYVHRVGRTGRAGESGVAVSFVSASTEAHLRLIERHHGLRVPRERVVGFEPLQTEVPIGPGPGGIKGKRPSKKDKLRRAKASEPS